MAASLTSKCSIVGFSLLAGFGNKASGSLSTSQEIAHTKFFSARQQQQRTFVQISTMLEVADNSGAKKAKCIQVWGPQKVAKLGDTIVVTVKEAAPAPNGAVKNGQVLHGVVVRSAMQSSRFGGFGIKFDSNAMVLIDSKTKKEKGHHSTKNKKKGDGPTNWEQNFWADSRRTKEDKTSQDPFFGKKRRLRYGFICGNFGMLGPWDARYFCCIARA